MNEKRPIHLFEGFGVELEYMIVDAESLSVLPIADKILVDHGGTPVSDIEMEEIAWSNELVLHLIELKTNGPAAALPPVSEAFQKNIRRINGLLASHGGRLMPSAMHPWMDPLSEMRLWPHEYGSIYETYDRIFNCRGHGWANLQATHLNLPFTGDDEFRRLHAAIRLVLPILPALAASSPIFEGRQSGLLDTRLDVYRSNARRIPSITGRVIPERVYTRAEYDSRILQRIYSDIRPYDPEGALQHEFLNSRGAIARFDRGAIEIRLLDVQECPAADLAICAAIVELTRALVQERWTSSARQQEFPTGPLAAILDDTIRDGERAMIGDSSYLPHFGLRRKRCLAGEIWEHVCDCLSLLEPNGPWAAPLELIFDRGPLARRIVTSVRRGASEESMRYVYRELCDCLAEGRLFQGC